MDKPNLIDPVGFGYIKKTITGQITSPNKIGGPFDFLMNITKMYWFFFITFFITIFLFLFWRYKEKNTEKKTQNIDQFIGSVNNYLYVSGSDELI
jgi:hypothetical protein